MKPSLVIFAAILTLSVAILACGQPSNSAAPVEPASTQGLPVVIATSQAQGLLPAKPIPAVPETRRLTLEYPPKMRAGVESSIVRLTLEVDDLGNITPTAQFEGN